MNTTDLDMVFLLCLAKEKMENETAMLSKMTTGKKKKKATKKTKSKLILFSS
jgi:hypothetical protein